MKTTLLNCALSSCLLLACVSAEADTCNGVSNNLVQNCGFETGTFASWGGTSPQNLFSGIDQGDPLTTNPTPYQGSFEAFLGSVAQKDTLGQTLTTTPGQEYTIGFAFLNDTTPSAPYKNSFQVNFGNDVLFSEADISSGGYQLYSFSAIASGSSTPFYFTTENQTGTFELDSVSVQPSAAAVTPEPDALLLTISGFLASLPLLRRRARMTA